MKKRPLMRFITRWFVCALGLWIAAGLLGERITIQNDIGAIIIAGLVLAIVNTFIKPVVIIMALPAILFSLGLFMIVVNGLMVYLTGQLYGGLHVQSFGSAMLAGVVIGLVNYLVTTILEEK